MALFGKKEANSTDAKDNSSQTGITSLIGPKMTITGDLEFSGTTKIDGTLTGNIKGNDLIIGPEGTVIGDPSCDSIVCYGSIDGAIKAGRFTAGATCKLSGKLDAGDLNVESGASLNVEITLNNQQVSQDNTQAAND